MIDRDSLWTAGYREFSMDKDGFHKKTLFQKRVSDDKGTCYFIDVYEYDWFGMRGFDMPRFSYEPQVQFYKGDGESMLVITVQDDAAKATPEALEAFVADLYTKIGAGYYELNP